MERGRNYARLLGKPKSKLVSLKIRNEKQSSLLRNEEEEVQEDIEDGRDVQRAIAEGRKDHSH